MPNQPSRKTKAQSNERNSIRRGSGRSSAIPTRLLQHYRHDSAAPGHYGACRSPEKSGSFGVIRPADISSEALRLPSGCVAHHDRLGPRRP
jgi:hypothetical protein